MSVLSSLAETGPKGVKEESHRIAHGKVVQQQQRRDHVWDDSKARWRLSRVRVQVLRGPPLSYLQHRFCE
jgi:hypothetical protein